MIHFYAYFAVSGFLGAFSNFSKVAPISPNVQELYANRVAYVRYEDDVMLSPSFVEHAALGFAFAVLSLFVLAFAIIAVVLVTVTNNCWWNCDSEGDPLMEDYNSFFPPDEEESEAGDQEPIDTVIGTTPRDASIV